MAFHVACPITCQRICFCSQGLRRGLPNEEARNEFLGDVARVEDFLKDPWLLRVQDKGTVQVAVPKVVAPPPLAIVEMGGGVADGDEMLLSAQTKRAALQKKAAAASLVAEDYARRFESGALLDLSNDLPGEYQGQSNAKVMCRLCYSGDNEGSESTTKMLPCKSCGKKYHRSCLTAWGHHRDLFHWTSWTCPSCRICEVCRRTGDQTRFMFCKRCDGAYHCYCQQPPHKNVSSGPYLCPKHTRCHSCGSNVPGNGLSTRWFFGYTCCDACGRLFVKGNYCPVCLKVYRDSESTPMVCCDVCQRWVHCQCDGISDEKYMQFQVDGNLQYKCATCRGECYQVRDLEDAVQELWRRRDEEDHDLIASLRAAAGLPTQEEIFSISPFSDDEESGHAILKNESGRSLKFSLKGLVDKSPKKTKEYGKKSSNKKFVKKKVYHPSTISRPEAPRSIEERSCGDNKNNSMQSRSNGEPFSSPIAANLSEGICSINQAGVLKHMFLDDVTVGNENVKSRVIHIKSSKRHASAIGDDNWKDGTNSNFTNPKRTKLVIHLSGRNRNVTSSPTSDASSYQREQELTLSKGFEDMSQEQTSYKPTLNGAAKFCDGKGPKLRGKEGNLRKNRKVISKVSEKTLKFGGDGSGSVFPANPHFSLRNRSIGESSVVVESASKIPGIRDDKVYLRRNVEGGADVLTGSNNGSSCTASDSHSLPRESKPLLKLKFKNPYNENPSSWAPQGEDEKSSVKGQRSKRKRPPLFMEKTSTRKDEDASQYKDNTTNELMDARILQKLGKDAIGKRVEVRQSSDNYWHKGTVKGVEPGTSIVFVALDNGSTKDVELEEEGIRFVSQKNKRCT